jgi:hypothetical protein
VLRTSEKERSEALVRIGTAAAEHVIRGELAHRELDLDRPQASNLEDDRRPQAGSKEDDHYARDRDPSSQACALMNVARGRPEEC